MVNILDNLFYSSTLPFGFALDYLIMILGTPVGFIAVFLMVAFFEYKTGESIIKKTKLIDFKKIKKVLSYMDKFIGEDVSMISPKWKLLHITNK